MKEGQLGLGIDARTEHSRLMERWLQKLQSPFFVDDGPVHWDAYEAAERKVVFLLKEPNIDPTNSLPRWSMGDFVLTEERGYTWNTLARWAHGLLAPAPTQWAALPATTIAFRREALRPVAVVNLNKAGGGAATDMEVLREKAHRVFSEIHEQLRLLRPHLIVACGTGDVLESLLGDGFAGWTQHAGEGEVRPRSFLGRNLPAPVLAGPHPQARMPGRDMYCAVVGAGRELLEFVR